MTPEMARALLNMMNDLKPYMEKPDAESGEADSPDAEAEQSIIHDADYDPDFAV